MPNLERLHHTYEVLKAMDPKKFYLGFWKAKTGEGCGTVCCAFGAEASTQYANENGLSISDNVFGDFVPYYEPSDQYGFTAASHYYDISLLDAAHLFDPSEYRGGDYTKITTVMNRIKKFICQHAKELKDESRTAVCPQ